MTNIEVTYIVTVKLTCPLDAYGGDTVEDALVYEGNLNMSDKAQAIIEALSFDNENVQIETTVRAV